MSVFWVGLLCSKPYSRQRPPRPGWTESPEGCLVLAVIGEAPVLPESPRNDSINGSQGSRSPAGVALFRQAKQRRTWQNGHDFDIFRAALRHRHRPDERHCLASLDALGRDRVSQVTGVRGVEGCWEGRFNDIGLGCLGLGRGQGVTVPLPSPSNHLKSRANHGVLSG